jgi:hypothetical protein
MNNRAEVLNEFHSRLLAKCTPALNTGTALDMLILVGQTLAEMQAHSWPVVMDDGPDAWSRP